MRGRPPRPGTSCRHRGSIELLFSCRGQGRGFRPRRRLPFLVSPRKGSKRRRPRFPRPLLPAASGAACGARVMGALHNSHRSLRSLTSDRCNESVHEARDARAPAHAAALLGAGTGAGSGNPLGPSLRSARVFARPSNMQRERGRAQRRPESVPDPDPTSVTAPSSAVAWAAREHRALQ